MAGKSRRKARFETPSKEKRRIFDFFALARELRDAIYEELLENHQLHNPKFDCHVTKQAKTNHLVISRQFQNELLKMVQEKGELIVSDTLRVNANEDLQAIPGNIPTRAFGLRSLSISFLIVDGYPELDFDAFLELTCLAAERMPNLRILRIKAIFDTHEHAKTLEQKLRASKLLTTIDVPLDFGIFYDDDDISNHSFDFDEQTNYMMQWKPSVGSFKHVKGADGTTSSST